MSETKEDIEYLLYTSCSTRSHGDDVDIEVEAEDGFLP